MNASTSILYAIYLILGAVILRILLLLVKLSPKTKINNMNNISNPPPHAEASSDPAAPMDSCPPAPKKTSPRCSRPMDIPSANHPCGERLPLPPHQSKSQKHGIKSKRPPLPAEPSTPPSASELEKVGGSRVRFRRSGVPVLEEPKDFLPRLPPLKNQLLQKSWS